MNYLVRVKPGHPTGVRRRSGQTFTAVPVEVESITDEMRADPWLQIVEIPARPLTDEERAAKETAETEETTQLDEEQTAKDLAVAPGGNEGGSRRRRNH